MMAKLRRQTELAATSCATGTQFPHEPRRPIGESRHDLLMLAMACAGVALPAAWWMTVRLSAYQRAHADPPRTTSV